MSQMEGASRFQMGHHSNDPALDAALFEDAAKLTALGADPGPTLADLDAMKAAITAALDDVKREALIAEMLRALRELLEAAELSDRDVDPHEYEAITEAAFAQARAAIAKATTPNN